MYVLRVVKKLAQDALWPNAWNSFGMIIPLVWGGVDNAAVSRARDPYIYLAPISAKAHTMVQKLGVRPIHGEREARELWESAVRSRGKVPG